MENKNNTWLGIFIALIGGLVIGSFLTPGFGMMRWGGPGYDMYEEMEERMEDMHNEDIIRQDGAMQHAMEEMMFGFRGKTGVEYEEVWLRGMIVHHIGAVEMSERLLKETERPELEAFANDIIQTQTKEVEQMREWLDEWFNNEN